MKSKIIIYHKLINKNAILLDILINFRNKYVLIELFLIVSWI